MPLFSQPRPNGSAGQRAVITAMKAWLEKRGIPFQIQAFPLDPYYFEVLGLWLLFSRLALVLAVLERSGWWATGIALLGALVGDFSFITRIPILTSLGRQTGENFLIEFEATQAQREVIISAHYDSKTEALDHRQRMFFLVNLRLGMYLTGALALLAPLDRWLAAQKVWLGGLTYATVIIFSLILLILAAGYGLNLASGRLLPQSTGAVDNGAACAILLGLAEKLSKHGLHLPLKVTLAIFSGEEVDRQGSRAYVREREFPLPTCALNLEVMAQDGDYVYWEQDGSVFRLLPTDAEVNAALIQAVQAVTGTAPQAAGPVTSDGGAFVEAGVPAAVLGTYHLLYKDTGFHSPQDSLDRIVPERLDEGVAILERFLAQCASEVK